MKDIVLEISKKIRTLENGMIAADMERNGLLYNHNYGVSVVHLRQFSQRYAPNQELAELLWEKDWRETRILASLIADPNVYKKEIIEKWIDSCTTSELVEQLSLNLVVKLPNVFTLVLPWLQSKNDRFVAVAATTLAHYVFRNKTSSSELVLELLKNIEGLSASANAFTRRSLALSIRRIGRMSKYFHEKSVKVAQQLETSNNDDAQWIAMDVLVELQDEFIVAGLPD